MKTKFISLEKYVNQNYNLKLDKKIDKSIQTELNIFIDCIDELINDEEVSKILPNFT